MLFLDLSFRFLIPLTPSNCSWRQRGSGSSVRSALPVPAHAAPRHCCEPARLPRTVCRHRHKPCQEWGCGCSTFGHVGVCSLRRAQSVMGGSEGSCTWPRTLLPAPQLPTSPGWKRGPVEGHAWWHLKGAIKWGKVQHLLVKNKRSSVCWSLVASPGISHSP